MNSPRHSLPELSGVRFLIMVAAVILAAEFVVLLVSAEAPFPTPFGGRLLGAVVALTVLLPSLYYFAYLPTVGTRQERVDPAGSPQDISSSLESRPLFGLETASANEDSGELIGYPGVRGVSKQRRLQDQLHQAQNMEAVALLAGGVAHDFNNLLMLIGGNAQLALTKIDADEHLRDHLEAIQHAGTRAAGLARQMLAFSRKQVLQPRVLDLNSIVSDFAMLLRRTIGEDIELVTEAQPGLDPVRIDPLQVEQVLINLAVNARDAMSRGGRLTVATSNVEVEELSALRRHGLEKDRYVLLTVADTGHGMDAEVKRRAFEPFFSTRMQGRGAGIGLPTARRIVEQSGGRILVESEPDQGTTFQIYLPADVGRS